VARWKATSEARNIKTHNQRERLSSELQRKRGSSSHGTPTSVVQGGTQFYNIVTARTCYDAIIECDHDEGARELARIGLLVLEEQEKKLARW
jgi:hypothetical protein